MDRRNKVDFDSVEYRKDLWEAEYSKSQGLLSSQTARPSSSLRKFIQSYNGLKDLAIDIGSGNGRNSIYLSENGFKNILAIEISEYASKAAANEVKAKGLSNIKVLNRSIEQGIEANDNSADLVIDMMSMHAMNQKERNIMFSEIKRVLKPGGQFLFFTLAKESPAAKELILKWSGIEDGSYRFEINGKVHSEKTFTKEELESLLSPLKPIYYEETQHDTPAFGNVYTRVYIHSIFQK